MRELGFAVVASTCLGAVTMLSFFVAIAKLTRKSHLLLATIAHIYLSIMLFGMIITSWARSAPVGDQERIRNCAAITYIATSLTGAFVGAALMEVRRRGDVPVSGKREHMSK